MKVLIAEDDAPLLQAMETKFTAAGFTVVTCTTGKEAIDHLKKHRYDVIVLDLLMPDQDGFDVLEARPSTKNKDTAVYVVTNLGRDRDCERAKDLGAKECYVKSRISLKEVVEIIAKEIA